MPEYDQRLADIESKVDEVLDRQAYTNGQVRKHDAVLFGSEPGLTGDGGLVGVLRSIRRDQRIIGAVLAAMVGPMAAFAISVLS